MSIKEKKKKKIPGPTEDPSAQGPGRESEVYRVLRDPRATHTLECTEYRLAQLKYIDNQRALHGHVLGHDELIDCMDALRFRH